jgi:hypothetical protein
MDLIGLAFGSHWISLDLIELALGSHWIALDLIGLAPVSEGWIHHLNTTLLHSSKSKFADRTGHIQQHLRQHIAQHSVLS